jgi:hypothetical protein
LVGKKKLNKKSDNIVNIGDNLNVVDVDDGFSIVNDFYDKTSSLNFVGMSKPNDKNCISDSDSYKPSNKRCSDPDSNNLSESDDETMTLEGIANQTRNSESESETSKSEEIEDSKSDKNKNLKCSDSEETDSGDETESSDFNSDSDDEIESSGTPDTTDNSDAEETGSLDSTSIVDSEWSSENKEESGMLDSANSTPTLDSGCSNDEETGGLDSSNLTPEYSGSETEDFQIENGSLEEKKTDNFDSDSDESKAEVSDKEESLSQNSLETGVSVSNDLQQSIGLRISLTSNNFGLCYEGTIVKIFQEERSILLTDVEVNIIFKLD